MKQCSNCEKIIYNIQFDKNSLICKKCLKNRKNKKYNELGIEDYEDFGFYYKNQKTFCNIL